MVESLGGVSPPGAPRTVHEPLDSHGSRCSAVAMTWWPVGEELGVRPMEPVEPVSCPLGLMAHPLELAARPPNDIGIDPLQGRTQPRLVEVAVIGDPAANARVVHLGQLLQGLVAAMMKRPTPNRPADGRQRFRTGGGHEAVGSLSIPDRLPGSKLKTQKIKRDDRKVAAPVRILAIRRSSSSPDAAPACRPQDDLQARSITPAPLWRFGSDKWHRPRSARMDYEDSSAPSTCRTRNAGTGSPGEARSPHPAAFRPCAVRRCRPPSAPAPSANARRIAAPMGNPYVGGPP